MKPPKKSTVTNQTILDTTAQTTTPPKTVHSKLKEAYTNIENPLAYTGDANKFLSQIKSSDAHAFMNQIKSFKFVCFSFQVVTLVKCTQETSWF